MPQTIFIKNRNEETVRILNNPGAEYDAQLWEDLKTRLGFTDQQLADALNNMWWLLKKENTKAKKDYPLGPALYEIGTHSKTTKKTTI